MFASCVLCWQVLFSKNCIDTLIVKQQSMALWWSLRCGNNFPPENNQGLWKHWLEFRCYKVLCSHASYISTKHSLWSNFSVQKIHVCIQLSCSACYMLPNPRQEIDTSSLPTQAFVPQPLLPQSWNWIAVGGHPTFSNRFLVFPCSYLPPRVRPLNLWNTCSKHEYCSLEWAVTVFTVSKVDLVDA